MMIIRMTENGVEQNNDDSYKFGKNTSDKNNTSDNNDIGNNV